MSTLGVPRTLSAILALAMEDSQQMLCIPSGDSDIWVVVEIMVPFWIRIIIRHLICRVPKRNP